MLLIHNLIFPWMLLLVFLQVYPKKVFMRILWIPSRSATETQMSARPSKSPAQMTNIVLLMMLNSTNSDRRRRRCAAARRYHHRCHRRLQKVGVRLAFSYYVIKNDPPWLHLRRSYCRRVWCGPFKCPKVGGRLRNALERRHSQTDLLIIVTMYAEFWIF